MRWFTYFILCYIALGIQTGIAAFARIELDAGDVLATPNFVLLAVVFISLNAPKNAAQLGAVILGLLQDLATGQRLGGYGLAYGIVSLMLVGAQSTVYREHPLTQFGVTLSAGIVTCLVLIIAGWIREPSQPSAMSLFAGALYTSLLAPVLIGILQKFKKAFSFQGSRRR